MEKYLNLIMRYEITSDTLKSLKKMIKGKISYIAPYLSFDYITKEEASAVLSYLDTLGTYEISLDENYYTVEELLNFEYFYCDGQRKPDVGINFVNFEFVENGNDSFDYTKFCPKCKKGLLQINPFTVKGLSSKYESKKLVTPFWTYWVVSAYFKEKIIEQNITGVDFWELFNSKGQASKTNFQMKPKYVLQNVLSLKDVKYGKDCPMCDNMRVGLKGEVLKLHKEAKDKLLDFNELSEHISKLNGMYIISKKLLKLFIDENIIPHKDIVVYPVEFV